MNRITRKVATMSAAGLLVLAGIGGVVGHSAAHAASPPAVAQAAPDPDQIQQELQSGNQQDLGGADKAEAGIAAAPEVDTVQSQNQSDTP